MIPIVASIANAVVGGVVGAVNKRQDRKAAEQQAVAKLAAAKQQGAHEVTLNDQELERINAKIKGTSWLDEFVTVSVYLVFYGIGIGAVASAFGYPQVLSGVTEAIVALQALGVDVGLLIEAVTFSAVGLTLWRRL